MANMNGGSNPGLTFVHLNTQSLYPKINQIQVMVEDIKPDFMCLSETWLSGKIPDGLVHIDNYSLFRFDRPSHKRGGGLACYVKNDIVNGIDATKYRSLWKIDDNIELQMFEVKIRHIKKMIVLNVYRPPAGKLQNFMDELYEALYSVDHLSEYEIYIMGDCNLPYNQKQSLSHKKLCEFEARFGLTQTLKVPTRYSVNTANILDLIFTNSKCILDSGTWDISISDHQPVFITRKKSRIKPKRTSFTCRCFSNYDRCSFQADLVNYNWDPYFLLTDPNEAWLFLYDVLTMLADQHCPYKQFTSKKVLPNWMSQNVLEHIKERDNYYASIKKSADPAKWAQLRKLKNQCNRLVKKAKDEFVRLQLDDSTQDPKKFWRVLNRAFGKIDNQNPTLEIVDPVLKQTIPETDRPDYMNQFLTEAGPKLASMLPDVPFHSTLRDFLSHLKFERITVEETSDIIDKIDMG